MLQLEVGKKYISNEGKEVTIIKDENKDLNLNLTYLMISEDSTKYTINGHYYVGQPDHPRSLKAEITTEQIPDGSTNTFIGASTADYVTTGCGSVTLGTPVVSETLNMQDLDTSTKVKESHAQEAAYILAVNIREAALQFNLLLGKARDENLNVSFQISSNADITDLKITKVLEL
jgi:hypothetical protein